MITLRKDRWYDNNGRQSTVRSKQRGSNASGSQMTKKGFGMHFPVPNWYYPNSQLRQAAGNTEEIIQIGLNFKITAACNNTCLTSIVMDIEILHHFFSHDMDSVMITHLTWMSCTAESGWLNKSSPLVNRRIDSNCRSVKKICWLDGGMVAWIGQMMINWL